jgi:hypothetical protein
LNLKGARPIPNSSVSEFIEGITCGAALSNPNISREFITNWQQWITGSKRNQLRGLSDYSSVRLTAGSAQIFDHFYLKHHRRRFRVLPGEFMYHSAVFKLGLDYLALDSDLHTNDAVIISVPFSDLGYQHTMMRSLLARCDQLAVPVLLDLSYLPVSKNIDLDLSHPCIDTLAFSISKAWPNAENLRMGIRLQRSDSDDGIDVFNSVDMINRLSCHVANQLITSYSVDWNWDIYGHTYHAVIAAMDLEPVDCILFGLDTKNRYPYLNRGGINNRVCISDAIGNAFNQQEETANATR